MGRARASAKGESDVLAVLHGNGTSIGPIVSSAHLAGGSSPGLSEVEYGLIISWHAFSRWMVRCMSAVGVHDLSPVEVLILHTIRHRGRSKKLADICLVLDIEDVHIASYAIRKLERAGLVNTGRQGKEKTVSISDKGADACDRYALVREKLLVTSTQTARPDEQTLSEMAAVLRFLSGAYEQAARAATTL